MKLGEFQEALQYFEESQTMAKQQSDSAALQAIQNAIQDVKTSMASHQNNNNDNDVIIEKQDNG